MINIREQMLEVIQSGIEGWVTAQFKGDHQSVDSITGYPLTIETARIYYRATIPYSAIERGYLEQVGGIIEFTPDEMQGWINYHWKYVYLELAEDFSNVRPLVTGDMLERRESIRQAMFGLGYKQVKI